MSSSLIIRIDRFTKVAELVYASGLGSDSYFRVRVQVPSLVLRDRAVRLAHQAHVLKVIGSNPIPAIN
jgi:hypothetical protein